MATEKITQLYQKGNLDVEIYPNIKSQNIPSNAVTLAKLSTSLQNVYNSYLTSGITTSILDDIINSLDSTLTSYGLDLGFTRVGTIYTFTFDDVAITSDIDDVADITIERVNLKKHGNHVFGEIVINPNDLIPSGTTIAQIHDSDLNPFNDTLCLAFKVGTPTSVTIDDDGLITCASGLDVDETLTIKVDWYL